MRIRYELYRNGQGTGDIVKCDLTDRYAKKLFKELKNDVRCGYAELVGEEEENYMEILDSFDHVSTARELTRLADAFADLLSK